MKNNKSNKVLLWFVKNKTLQLRKNYQLPLYLTSLIISLNEDSNVDYVRCLLNLTTELMRVKKYYKTHPQAEKESKEFIVKYLASMGF